MRRRHIARTLIDDTGGCMLQTPPIPLVRVFRARRGERPEDARLRRAELVTLDPADLRILLRRCATGFDRVEADAIVRATRALAPGASADIFVATDGRIALEERR